MSKDTRNIGAKNVAVVKLAFGITAVIGVFYLLVWLCAGRPNPNNNTISDAGKEWFKLIGRTYSHLKPGHSAEQAAKLRL